jgi:hypothetical protein
MPNLNLKLAASLGAVLITGISFSQRHSRVQQHTFGLGLAYLIGCSHLETNVCSYLDSWPQASFIGQILCSTDQGVVFSATKRERFQQAFAVVRQELFDAFAAQGVPDDAQNWYKRVCLDSLPLLKY